jgi:1,4-dihydroxy-2-naphthoate octaprenyltransferase
MERILLFFRLSRPHFLLGVAVLYALGAGVAKYLGIPLDPKLYLIGQAWVTLLQLGAQYLNEYYDYPMDLINPNRTWLTGGSGALGKEKLPLETALVAAVACMAGAAALAVLMLATLNLPPAVYLIMTAAFLVAVFYSAPPLRLKCSGYGELTVSILVNFLVPVYALLFQAGEVHRLALMGTLPLCSLMFAMLIVFELPDYVTDLQQGCGTLLGRAGWQKTMLLHNLAVIFAYFILLLALAMGMPRAVALPAFLMLPLAGLQVWMMRKVEAGAKPDWKKLTLVALAHYMGMVYLITYSFWMN